MRDTHLATLGTLLTVAVALASTVWMVVRTSRASAAEDGEEATPESDEGDSAADADARRRLEMDGRTGVLRLGDLFEPTLVAFGCFLTLTFLTVAVGALNFFGLVNLAYQHLVVGVPLVGAALLTAGWWSGPVIGRLTDRGPESPLDGFRLGRGPLVAMSLTPLLVVAGVYTTHVEPFALTTDEVVLEVDGLEGDGFVIGVLSDLQADRVLDHHRDAIDRVMAAEPDVVVIAGDFHQGADTFERELPAWRDLIGRLSAPGGVFVVGGDTDEAGWLPRIIEGTGAVYLRNEVAATEVAGVVVHVGGVTLVPDPIGDDVLAEVSRPDDDVFSVLLAHRPDWGLRLPPGEGPDLIVAGHTHGGQIALPGIGPLVTVSDVPRDVAAGGLNSLRGVPIYVSTGVGWEHLGAPRVRFGAPPSVGIIEVVPG